MDKMKKEQSILVSDKLKSSKLLASLKLPHKFIAGLAEDFFLSQSISILFLSLKYHSTYPLYIKERLNTLAAKTINNKCILLCLIDSVIIIKKV